MGSVRSVQVLRDPSEPLSVSLPLEDAAHEELQGAPVQLAPRHLPLAGGLPVQPEHLSELVLSGSAGSVNLVSKDENGTIAQLLVSQQRLQLNLALAEPCPITTVHQEHDGVHRGEVILPDSPGLVMAAQVECGEPGGGRDLVIFE